MRALPYIIAFIAGLFLRTLVAFAGGITSYSMNGADWLVALICVVIVWSFKETFLPKRKRVSRHDNRR